MAQRKHLDPGQFLSLTSLGPNASNSGIPAVSKKL